MPHRSAEWETLAVKLVVAHALQAAGETGPVQGQAGQPEQLHILCVAHEAQEEVHYTVAEGVGAYLHTAAHTAPHPLGSFKA